MKTRIITIHNRVVSKVSLMPNEKMGYFLIWLIVCSLALYILGLNLAVSESYKRETLRKDMKILKQDLQEKEEELTSKFSDFYIAHASSFVAAQNGDQKFVSRRSNVAQAPSEFLR